LRTEGTFQCCIDYADIAGANLVSCEGCHALTFALARLSCSRWSCQQQQQQQQQQQGTEEEQQQDE